jgi:hypothetical protein
MAVSRRISSDTLLVADCLAADVAGHCVYVTGPKVGGRVQVTKVDPRDLSKIPGFGIIRVKVSSTVCVVQTMGELSGIYAGLTPQAQLWVGLDGLLTQTQPTPLPAGKVAVQQMAIALGTGSILIQPQSPIIDVG